MAPCLASGCNRTTPGAHVAKAQIGKPGGGGGSGVAVRGDRAVGLGAGLDKGQLAGAASVGLDWSEPKRIPGVVNGSAPWTVKFPMCEPPLLSKQDMFDACRAAGVEPPRLYELGFSQNNFYWTSRDARGRWHEILKADRLPDPSFAMLRTHAGSLGLSGLLRRSKL